MAISSSKCAYKLVEKLKKALDVGLKVKEKRWDE